MPQAKPAEYFAKLKSRVRPDSAGTQPLAHFADLFLTDKRAAGASDSYNRDLTRAMARFIGFLKDALGREPLLGDLNLEAARAYALYEADRVKWEGHPIHSLHPSAKPKSISPTSVRLSVRYVRTFASWLYREEWTKTHVLDRLELPKAVNKEVRPLTRDEETRLVRACDDRTRDGSRRLAVLLLFLDTGARLSEVAGLRVGDIDFARGIIHTRWESAKGKKERSVSFGAKTERALKRYAMVFREPALPEADPDDAFFLNPDGDPITSAGIAQMFKRMAKRAKVENFHPHRLRHTAGTRDIERGKSTREVQNKLGHSSVLVTERYTHIVEQEKANRRRDSHVDELPITIRKTKK